ncbi:MAG: hypothetical protein AB7I27_06955 [Bacteriovoracaceae bacterium]
MLRLNESIQLVNIFQHLVDEKNKHLLWQHSKDTSKKIVIHSKISNLNISNNEMTLHPEKGEFKFNNRSYLYFYSLHRSILFKATILYHSHFKIVIRLPEMIMLPNSRVQERKVFSNDQVIRYVHNSEKNSTYHQLYLNSKLLDLSENGLSFKSSISNIVKFNIGDKLLVKMPEQQSILREAEIRYITKVTSLRPLENFLRVGVKLY